MKLIPAAILAGLALSATCVVISIETNTTACRRYTAMEQAKLQDQEPNPWDIALTKAGIPRLPERQPLVESVEGTINAFPGANPCDSQVTEMQLLNSILAGILAFAAIVIPPTVLRGLFSKRTHS